MRRRPCALDLPAHIHLWGTTYEGAWCHAPIDPLYMMAILLRRPRPCVHKGWEDEPDLKLAYRLSTPHPLPFRFGYSGSWGQAPILVAASLRSARGTRS